METKKLYYEDCHLRKFTALVKSCEKTDKGWEVILDATAFYPEGGGQACDLGTLGGSKVLDVRERGEEVIHLCDRPLAVYEEVEGSIDWQQRMDLMQQHSGEHIVSGIIHRMFGWHNVGFHMGAQTVTIDFDGPIGDAALTEIEQQANEAVWQNLPVKCWYPSEEELPYVGYRSKKALPWPVRVVEIPGYDKCACCGVHTAYTGEIGLIKLLSCVKFHQGVRIEMVCGARALAFLNKVYEQNRQVSQLFSAKVLETAQAAEQINRQLNETKYQVAGLQKRIFATLAEGYAGKGNVLHIEPDLEPGDVRKLADAIADSCGGIGAVASGSDALGYSLCIVSKTGDVRELGKAAFGALNGRGGGKPGSVQGSVKATEKELQAFFEGEFVK